MQIKTCTKCKRTLPVSNFHSDKRREFGVSSQCRDCRKEYRNANKDKLLVAQYKRVAEKHEILSPMRKAWNALYYALKIKKISKPDKCSICGKITKVQAHHVNYNKPFDVTWCCQDCHVSLDKERREVQYGNHICQSA